MQKFTLKITTSIAIAATFSCVFPFASNAGPIASIASITGDTKDERIERTSPKPPKKTSNESKIDGIGILFMRLNEPQMVCKSRESAEIINLIVSEDVDESTRQKMAPLAMTMCKSMTSNEPLEVVRVITNEGTIEVKSLGEDSATGFIPMNSMREEGVAFFLIAYPGLGKSIKSLLEKFGPQWDNKIPERNSPKEPKEPKEPKDHKEIDQADLAMKIRI